MMLLSTVASALFFALVCALFYYCQAMKSGLGKKRWAVAGLIFGPVAWPMFLANKRMKARQFSCVNALIFKA